MTITKLTTLILGFSLALGKVSASYSNDTAPSVNNNHPTSVQKNQNKNRMSSAKKHKILEQSTHNANKDLEAQMAATKALNENKNMLRNPSEDLAVSAPLRGHKHRPAPSKKK